jgi:hypothetical protein
MTDAEARSLLCQSRLPEASKPVFHPDDVEAIRDHCGNHPMLLQIVAKRFQEIGDLQETFSQVAADRAVQHLFAVDFELLAPAERDVLLSLEGSASDGAVQRLLQLGLIRRGGPRGLTVPNRFLASWLHAIESSSKPHPYLKAGRF